MKKSTLLLALMFIASFSFAQTLPIDFEGGPGSIEFTDFDGGATQIISNPDATGINTSDYVAEHIRDGGQTWAGTYIQLESALDFTTNNTFSMKVWSPATDIPVLLKIENADDPSVNVERTTSTTVANEWEELTFDFGEQSNDTYHKIVLIFNLGVLGNGSSSSTYYFDDIVFFDSGAPTLDQIDLPVTFELETMDYTLTDFGGNSSTVGEDPTNAANTVAISVKTEGAETWAGTTMGTESGFANAIPFTDDATTIEMKVYAPAADIPVMLKVEDKNDPTIYGEVTVNTTVAEQWETLVFDYAGVIDLANTYDKASVFFDFNTQGDGATYYWDDVSFGPLSTAIGTLDAQSVNVYPNPVEDVFVVQGADKISDISIYSVSGQRVEIQQLSDNSFDISNLSSGVYIISFTNQDGNVLFSKLIKK